MLNESIVNKYLNENTSIDDEIIQLFSGMKYPTSKKEDGIKWIISYLSSKFNKNDIENSIKELFSKNILIFKNNSIMLDKKLNNKFKYKTDAIAKEMEKEYGKNKLYKNTGD